MESYCNKNVPGGRNSRGVSDRNNCSSVNCGNEGMMRNRERQMGNCDRAVLRQDRMSQPCRMTQPCRREENVRTGCERERCDNVRADRGRVELTRNPRENNVRRGNQENCGQRSERAGERREGCSRENCNSAEKNRERNVEVECVCQVKPVADCHVHDEMEHLGCDFPLVMAYVPWQQWGDLYEAEQGLMQGTIFKDLNFIFCGERC